MSGGAALPRRTASLALIAALTLGVCAKCPGLGPRQWGPTSSVEVGTR